MLSIRVPMQVLCWNRFLCVQVPKSGADASAVFWCTAWNSPGHSTAILPFEGWTGNSITFEWSTATERIMEPKRTCTEIQRPWSWFCLWIILSVFQCSFVLESSSHTFDLADSCINVGLHIGVNLPGTATGRQSSKKGIWQGTENVILSQDKTIQNTDNNTAIKWIEKKSVLSCCTL